MSATVSDAQSGRAAADAGSDAAEENGVRTSDDGSARMRTLALSSVHTQCTANTTQPSWRESEDVNEARGRTEHSLHAPARMHAQPPPFAPAEPWLSSPYAFAPWAYGNVANNAPMRPGSAPWHGTGGHFIRPAPRAGFHPAHMGPAPMPMAPPPHAAPVLYGGPRPPLLRAPDSWFPSQRWGPY